MKCNKWILITFFFCMTFGTFAEVPSPENWPLKNGDFRGYITQNGLPTCWNKTVQSGSYSFGREPGDTGIQNDEQAVTITSLTSGQAVWWQQVNFLPGDYTLTVDVYASSGAVAKIAAPGGTGLTITGTEQWQEANYDFTASGLGNVYLYLVGDGTAKFRRVNVTIRSLTSGAVPFASNLSLGRTELPLSPEPAEAYAAYELQRYIYLMTGTTPGLSGRDNFSSGCAIKVGWSLAPAAIQTQLNALSPDSYYVGFDGDDIILAGNTETGTLYAVYDFLKQQGCDWLAPTTAGRVVPQRSQLLLPSLEGKIEEPDYLVRGMMLSGSEFYSNGGWRYLNIENYFDWAVWNRINCLIFTYGTTADFGAHRGYGRQQTVNHSWAQFLLDDHPEWWPLVDGVRTKLHSSGRPNQLSVSNEDLRDYVVATIADYFDENPEAAIYALNANDEPACWCESTEDRSLDSDYGAGTWVKSSDCMPELSMTDRTVHFVNEIASQVSSAYPGKKIECYSYASTYDPPTRWLVDPAVMIKVTYWPGAPNNKPILDNSHPYNAATIERMEGWLAAGAVDMGLYDYGLLRRPDSSNFNYYHQTDYLKTFNKEWGIRHCITENNAVLPSLMWNLLRARSYWNVNINYLEEIQDICTTFYGSAANSMIDYYTYMQQAAMDYDLWAEFPEGDIPAVMAIGRELLEQAVVDADSDTTVIERIAYAQFGHAVATEGICKLTGPTLGAKREISKSYYLVNELYSSYDAIMFSKSTDAITGELWFVPYGYLWNRTADWTAAMNPDDGPWGEPAWQYQYVARGGELGSEQPWYKNPPSDMIWKDPAWKRSSFASAPIIYDTYIQQQIGAAYNPVIAWINSTSHLQEIKLSGDIIFRWMALCDVTDVDFAVVHRNASSGQTTLLYSQSIEKPTPSTISVNEQCPLTIELPNLLLDKDDEILITLQLTSSSGSGVVQIIDDNLKIELSEYQPQYCGDRNTVYPVGDVSGPGGPQDCVVDIHDFACLSLDWLTCTDPQACE